MKRGKSLSIGEKKYTKSNLPTKICSACNRPFAWRKRWEKTWAEVKFCSERCRRNKKNDGRAASEE